MRALFLCILLCVRIAMVSTFTGFIYINSNLSMKYFFLLIFPFVFASANGQNFDNLSFGTDSTFDVATWNIEHFPKQGQATINYVVDIIHALDLDYIGIQEVEDTTAFTSLINQLDGYEGFYQQNPYAGLGVIYKTDVLTVNSIYEIYTASAYWSPFPRAPIVMDVEFMGAQYILINNHWKCCGNNYLDLNNPNDEEYRRWKASMLLKGYIDNSYPDANVILMGDLNDQLTDPPLHNVFQNFLDDPENYRFVDMAIAQGPSSNWSYPSWPSHLDHILITNELFDEMENASTEVACIKLENYFSGNGYKTKVSDHRPVALKFKPNALNVGLADSKKITPVYFNNYPNPAVDFTVFQWNGVKTGARIEIYNSIGQKLDEISVGSGDVELTWYTDHLAGGIYLARLVSDEGVLGVRRVIVSR